RLELLKLADGPDRRRMIAEWWKQSDRRQVFLLVKLLTGEMRIGVSGTLVVRALAQTAGLPVERIADRVMGDWRPSAGLIERVMDPAASANDGLRPYPFYLASPIDPAPPGGDEVRWLAEQVGPIEQYQIEWKWDGIRAQLLKRGGESSRGGAGMRVTT